MASLKYTHAIVCRIPRSCTNEKSIDYDKAKKEHENFVEVLRSTGIDVLELPADELLPCSPCVEDTAIACNGLALIAQPYPARIEESKIIKAVLKKELELPVVDVADPSATLEGGDVLFTGREFFVGLSKWTNEAGARAVAATFPEFPCTTIEVPTEGHLKSLVTMAAPDILCVGCGKTPQQVLNNIKKKASYSYQTLTVPEDSAANVLYVNGTLIHRSDNEIPASCKLFQERLEFSREPVSASELVKMGCGLSSCCLLIRRSRHCKIF